MLFQAALLRSSLLPARALPNTSTCFVAPPTPPKLPSPLPAGRYRTQPRNRPRLQLYCTVHGTARYCTEFPKAPTVAHRPSLSAPPPLEPPVSISKALSAEAPSEQHEPGLPCAPRRLLLFHPRRCVPPPALDPVSCRTSSPGCRASGCTSLLLLLLRLPLLPSPAPFSWVDSCSPLLLVSPCQICALQNRVWWRLKACSPAAAVRCRTFSHTLCLSISVSLSLSFIPAEGIVCDVQSTHAHNGAAHPPPEEGRRCRRRRAAYRRRHRLRVRRPLGRPGQGDERGPRAVARRGPLGRRRRRGAAFDQLYAGRIPKHLRRQVGSSSSTTTSPRCSSSRRRRPD